MIIEERRLQMWRDYTATALWMIGKTLAQETWGLEQYSNIAYPQKVDNRTSAEIISDLLRKLEE